MTRRFAFIFARGGSKGLPNKNIMDFCGVPLIAHSILQAKKTQLFDEIIVSTDSEKIKDIALKYGAIVPFMRPLNLSQDESPEWLAWQHAVDYMKKAGRTFDIFASLPATSPLRNEEDIKETIKIYENSNVNVTMCVTESYRNPYFNMVMKNHNGYYERVIKSELFRRQDAPLTYDMTTMIFVTNPKFIMNNNSIFDGKISVRIVDRERAIDIDDEFDFKLAEYLYGKK
jgi:CMP-N-acetylneuraminic acid synthetase